MHRVTVLCGYGYAAFGPKQLDSDNGWQIVSIAGILAKVTFAIDRFGFPDCNLFLVARKKE